MLNKSNLCFLTLLFLSVGFLIAMSERALGASLQSPTKSEIKEYMPARPDAPRNRSALRGMNVILGLNRSTMEGFYLKENGRESRTNFVIGGSTEVNITSQLALEIGLQYESFGEKYKITTRKESFEDDIKFQYMTIPAYAKFYFMGLSNDIIPFLRGGIKTGFLFDSSVTTTSTQKFRSTEFNNGEINSLDPRWALGLGAAFPVVQEGLIFFSSIDFEHSLRRVNLTGSENIYHQALGLNVGLSL